MAVIDLFPCNDVGQDNCVWDANTMPGGDGSSYVTYNGTTYPVATDADTFITFPVTVDTDAGVMSVNLEQYVVVAAPTEENPDATETVLFATFSRQIDITPGEVIIEVPVTPETPVTDTPVTETPVTDATTPVETTESTQTVIPSELAATGPAEGLDFASAWLAIALLAAGVSVVIYNKFRIRT